MHVGEIYGVWSVLSLGRSASMSTHKKQLERERDASAPLAATTRATSTFKIDILPDPISPALYSRDDSRRSVDNRGRSLEADHFSLSMRVESMPLRFVWLADFFGGRVNCYLDSREFERQSG